MWQHQARVYHTDGSSSKQEKDYDDGYSCILDPPSEAYEVTGSNPAPAYSFRPSGGPFARTSASLNSGTDPTVRIVVLINSCLSNGWAAYDAPLEQSALLEPVFLDLVLQRGAFQA